MKRGLLFGLLLVLAAAALPAQDTQREAFARKLADSWAKNGVVISQGLGSDGVQNLAVLAWQGYFPLKTTAKAGVPSVLRLYTHKTYDCSRAFGLPDLGLRAVLGPNGFKEFKIPAMKKGETLYGTCSMGMYDFEIVFQ